jgi:hypothetical protein
MTCLVNCRCIVTEVAELSKPTLLSEWSVEV